MTNNSDIFAVLGYVLRPEKYEGEHADDADVEERDLELEQINEIIAQENYDYEKATR